MNQNYQTIKKISQKILILLSFLSLFFYQLHILSFESNNTFSPIFLTYTFLLFTNGSLFSLSILLLLLEFFTFMATGIAGLSLFFIPPTSLFFLSIEKHFYYQIISPFLFIFSHFIFLQIIFSYFLKTPFCCSFILYSSLLHCLYLLCLWKLFKKS